MTRLNETISRATAAWSRDSLTAWQWLLDNTEPLPHIGTSPQRVKIHFLENWAIKILCLVNAELGYCDWYWFLSKHFDRELMRVDPVGRKPLRELHMFTGGEFETDPKAKSGE